MRVKPELNSVWKMRKGLGMYMYSLGSGKLMDSITGIEPHHYNHYADADYLNGLLLIMQISSPESFVRYYDMNTLEYLGRECVDEEDQGHLEANFYSGRL